MKHKHFVGILLFIIAVILVGYVGISLYLILDQTSKIELLKIENYSNLQKIKELEDMIISANQSSKSKFVPRGTKLPQISLKSKELQIANLNFLNTQQYIPNFLPTTNHIITKSFLPEKNHFGIDLAGENGNPIFAAATGIVEKVKNDSIFGKSIIIDHLNGYKTFYGHNSEILVDENFFVKKGDIIAKLGNTGRSSAPHLHFEILFKEENINPEKMIKK
ncbi:MAG: M23 family metallopeptidase [Candidatus Cloacimonetes bacterium]|nr:M23 family metallopeptidase [Candidatus Cloacimonadota bacterium]